MTHLDAVVHHHVPILTSQDLQRCSFTNTSIIVNYKRGISYIGISETWKTVKQAWKKSSKVAREASGPNLPPKSWKKDSQEWKVLTRKRWHLHAEEGEDEDEENEEDEQGDDGGDGVHEGLDQAAHGFPVPVRGQQR